jgi:hypothetical protein
MLNEEELRRGGWVKAKEVLTDFSTVRSFVSGDGLPRLAADYWYSATERKVRGLIQFGIGSEGMPGFVHGGAISGVFDEAVGLLSWYLGVPVATRELVVRYQTFVPVNCSVHLEGHVLIPDCWTVRGSAVMTALDGTVHATAQGSFLELDPALVTSLAKRNAARLP